jgi:hypothetical protein
MLFAKEKVFWLDGSITEGGSFADLHTYLIGTKKYQWSREWETEPLHEGLLVDAESLVSKLTAQFLLGQPLDWLIKLIHYITAVQNSLDLRYRPLKSLVIWIRFYCFENQVSFSRFSCCPNYTKDNFICSFI